MEAPHVSTRSLRMLHVKHVVAVSVTALLATLSAQPALAHGGDPLPRDVLELPGASGWVLSTNFGLMSSEDLDHYVCEEAFLGGDNFLVAPLGALRWVTFSEAAIMRTEDGCSFERVGELTEVPVSVDVSADGARVAYLTNQPELDALAWSEDEGRSFQGISLAAQGDVQWTGVGFADADRVFITGYSRAEADKGSARLLEVTLSTGEVRALDGLEGVRYPYLFDAEAGRMAGIATGEASLLTFWGSPDEVAAWRRDLESWPTGIELSSDGAQVFISGATAEGGVLRGELDASEPSWEILYPEHAARCVGLVGEQLYLCARRAREGHDLSRIVDDQPEEVLEFRDLQGPRPGCAPDTEVARTCAVVWPELALALRIELPDMGEAPAADMGADVGAEDMAGGASPQDMGADMSAPVDMSSGASGGSDGEEGACASAGRPAPGSPWLGAVLLLGVGWLRRRSPSTSCTR